LVRELVGPVAGITLDPDIEAAIAAFISHEFN
jgi:hypothetical protein